MGLKTLSALALAAMAGVSQAALFVESEANNTLATADFIGSYAAPGDGIVVDGTITPGDVDWFCFTITDPAAYVVSAAFALPTSTAGDDGFMGLFDSSGTLLESDDDDNIGFMPALEFAGLTAGTYYIALTGFGDPDFNGSGHTENFAYKMVIGLNLIPTPGAVALLGLGGLAAARRRR
jgi:hypothetical protein